MEHFRGLSGNAFRVRTDVVCSGSPAVSVGALSSGFAVRGRGLLGVLASSVHREEGSPGAL